MNQLKTVNILMTESTSNPVCLYLHNEQTNHKKIKYFLINFIKNLGRNKMLVEIF